MIAVCINNHSFSLELGLSPDGWMRQKCPQCSASLSNVVCKHCEKCVGPFSPCESCGKQLVAAGVC